MTGPPHHGLQVQGEVFYHIFHPFHQLLTRDTRITRDIEGYGLVVRGLMGQVSCQVVQIVVVQVDIRQSQ